LILISESINGTIEEVREAVVSRDASFIGGLAREQAMAGADYIDVNVGTGLGDECEAMVWALEVVRSATDLPLCIDSSDAEVLAAGLNAYGSEKPFVNSVTGAPESLSAVLPMAARHGCPLVALAMDESGIPSSPAGRLAVCRKIVDAACEAGIKDEDLYVDPLVMPVSADCEQGRVTLETLRAIKLELEGVRTIMAVSNVSFGLPLRSLANCSMITMAAFLGLDAAILDTSDRGLRSAIISAETVSGKDRFCKEYMKAYRADMLE
jgi:5-methyltetrahydrofolate corrinoid/iron sulfur protein methyltransferase